MKLYKPKFWSKKYSLFSILLFPISFVLQILISIKNRLMTARNFNIPVICVGNIYLGGTGKTPLSILIAEELIKQQKKPSIIKKYYPKHKDEHDLINQKVNCLFLAKNRYQAIKNAEKNKCDVAILDDGFQDYSIKKDISILCFNERQLIGNGMTLPSGPLRENISGIKRADIVIINGDRNILFEKKIHNISKNIDIYYSKYVPVNINKFKNKKLFAFAGIGNPENFFDLLVKNNLNLKKKISFPDHHHFNKKELQVIVNESLKKNLELITTEKDYIRIKNMGIKNIGYLELKLEITKKNNLIKKINDYL